MWYSSIAQLSLVLWYLATCGEKHGLLSKRVGSGLLLQDRWFLGGACLVCSNFVCTSQFIARWPSTRGISTANEESPDKR